MFLQIVSIKMLVINERVFVCNFQTSHHRILHSIMYIICMAVSGYKTRGSETFLRPCSVRHGDEGGAGLGLCLDGRRRPLQV